MVLYGSGIKRWSNLKEEEKTLPEAQLHNGTGQAIEFVAPAIDLPDWTQYELNRCPFSLRPHLGLTCTGECSSLSKSFLKLANITLVNNCFNHVKGLQKLGHMVLHRGAVYIAAAAAAQTWYLSKYLHDQRFWGQNFTQKVRKSRQWQIYDKSAKMLQNSKFMTKSTKMLQNNIHGTHIGKEGSVTQELSALVTKFHL